MYVVGDYAAAGRGKTSVANCTVQGLLHDQPVTVISVQLYYSYYFNYFNILKNSLIKNDTLEFCNLH